MDLATLRAKHAALSPVLTERSRRAWAATEARAIGLGRRRASGGCDGDRGVDHSAGLRNLASGDTITGAWTRKASGGRRRATDLDATLLRDLDALVEPTAPGEPDSPLWWTCLSGRTLAMALEAPTSRRGPPDRGRRIGPHHLRNTRIRAWAEIRSQALRAQG